jgi:hypothetical protein
MTAFRSIKGNPPALLCGLSDAISPLFHTSGLKCQGWRPQWHGLTSAWRAA